ncbi:MAG: acyltransferase family protein, partial [Candidatus Helarchaeota archaeon]|nr:acyltransferase family protein [Candidatus Helarchaeota archaeon]
MESPDSQSRIQSASMSRQKEIPPDWRPDVLRLFSIVIIVLGHMLFYTGYLLNDPRNPVVWLGGVAIGLFFACSGYVHSLKDEFNKPGSLNLSTYGKFLKKRFLRLYIGYYLALFVVLIAKLLSGITIEFSTTAPLQFGFQHHIIITPTSLILDLTCMWPLFTTKLGGIWPEGWFICSMLILSLCYPLLRRLHSIKKIYLYLVMIIALIVRFTLLTLGIYTGILILATYAFYFPFAWTAEYSLGIIAGNRVGM